MVAHDNEIVRRGLEGALSQLDVVACVESCPSWSTAVPRMEALRVENGCTSVPVGIVSQALIGSCDDAIARPAGGVRLLVLLDDTDTSRVRAIAKLGADGFLLESGLTSSTLSNALFQLRTGQIPMPSVFTRALLAEVSLRQTETDKPFFLTDRELQALDLVARGFSNKQIARQMNIGINGVKRHVSNLLAKLNCPNRTQAAAYAVKSGLVEPEK